MHGSVTEDRLARRQNGNLCLHIPAANSDPAEMQMNQHPCLLLDLARRSPKLLAGLLEGPGQQQTPESLTAHTQGGLLCCFWNCLLAQGDSP